MSDVDIDNLVATGTLTIDTRSGADSVRIETDGVYGASTFKAASSIALGEGDDLLRIGQDSGNNRVLIMAQLIARGGAGTDTRNDLDRDNQFGPRGSVVEEDFENSIPA